MDAILRAVATTFGLLLTLAEPVFHAWGVHTGAEVLGPMLMNLSNTHTHKA